MEASFSPRRWIFPLVHSSNYCFCSIAASPMKGTIFVLSPSKPETFFSRPSICFLGRIKNLIDRLIDNPAFSISANNRRYLNLAIHKFYTYSKAR